MRDKLKKKLNKKGVAIELAIVTLLVIFALCSILLTVAELSVYTNKRIATKASERAELSQAADDLILALRGPAPADVIEERIAAIELKYEDRFTFTRELLAENAENLTYIISDLESDDPVMKLVFDATGKLIEFYGEQALNAG